MKCKVCGSTEFEDIRVITGIDIKTKGGLNIGFFNVGVDSYTNVKTVNLKACKSCGIMYYNR